MTELEAEPVERPRLPLLRSTDELIAVDKPAGWLVHNSKFAGPREEHTVCGVLAEQLGHPVQALHRLDRQTSGVLLLAGPGGHPGVLREQLAAPSSRKVYWAVVRGKTLRPQELEHAVKSSSGPRKDARSTVLAVHPSPVDRCSLVWVELHTGRYHQVRQHLRHLHHPVLGDSTHGDVKENRRYRNQHGLPRLALHAARVELQLDDERIAVGAPPPADLVALLERLELLNAAEDWPSLLVTKETD